MTPMEKIHALKDKLQKTLLKECGSFVAPEIVMPALNLLVADAISVFSFHSDDPDVTYQSGVELFTEELNGLRPDFTNPNKKDK